MIDSKESDNTSLKNLLRNKRTLKGTPLHRLATRYAGYFALSLGCAHVSIGYFVYYAEVDDWWFKSGPEYISRKVVQFGMYEKLAEDPQTQINEVTEDLKNTFAYTTYSLFTTFFNNIKERFFSNNPLDARSEPGESVKGASALIGQLPDTSTIKDMSK